MLRRVPNEHIFLSLALSVQRLSLWQAVWACSLPCCSTMVAHAGVQMFLV